ncbi:hypothetical protein [Sphingomonas sp. Leaf4]|nr:hypothetical protein [Sphingomonas sp. Leaf4]
MIALAQSATFAVAAVAAIGTIAATVMPQRARIVAILRAGSAGGITA